jgi:hypothetical protein
MTVLERVPGKVVAVHVSYRSRAAEHGAMPAWPSYFLTEEAKEPKEPKEPEEADE